MPGGDRTGPRGLGPMTGRGAGFCSGYPGPGYSIAGPGCGPWGRRWGMGAGRGGPGGGRGFGFRAGAGWAGRGFGPWSVPGNPLISDDDPGWGAPVWGRGPAREASLDSLRAQASHLEELLRDIRSRIGEKESAKADEPGG